MTEVNSLSILPQFLNLDQPLIYDDCIERTEIQEIDCTKAAQGGANLNGDNAQILFKCDGNFFYRLGSSNTGFLVKVGFITQAAGANSRVADITLASSFFYYMWSRANLQINGNVVESYDHVGITCDVFNHLESSDYKRYEGAQHSYIPDTSSNASSVIGRTPTVTAAQVGAAADIVTNLSNKAITIDSSFNEGYMKRKNLYNYTVATHNTRRDITFFVPLNRLFHFCCELDKVQKYMPFEVELIRERQALNTHCVYGATNTAITFGTDDTGLISIQLRVETYFPKATIVKDIEDALANPIQFSYYRRYCEERLINNSKTFTYEKTCSREIDGEPRYLLVGFKTTADDTAQINYQRFPHCNIQNITVHWKGNIYPYLPQNSEFLLNNFAKHYHNYIQCGRSLGNKDIALSMSDFRDLYTVFAFDLTARPAATNSNVLSVKGERREVPAADTDPNNPINLNVYYVMLNEQGIYCNIKKKEIRKF